MGMMIHRHKLKVQRAVEQTAPVIEKQADVIVEEKKTYTKTEISRMSTAELQNLANDEGIENALEKSGAELKRVLVEHFGL